MRWAIETRKIYKMQSRPDGEWADPNDGGVIMAKYIVQSIAVPIMKPSVYVGLAKTPLFLLPIPSLKGPLTSTEL